MMSTSTTSASSFAAIQCAAVAPTFPAPTIVTFFRIFLLQSGRSRCFVPKARPAGRAVLHIADHAAREFARLRLGRTGHLALKIVRDILLLDGLLQRTLDQLRRLVPT